MHREPGPAGDPGEPGFLGHRAGAAGAGDRLAGRRAGLTLSAGKVLCEHTSFDLKHIFFNALDTWVEVVDCWGGGLEPKSAAFVQVSLPLRHLCPTTPPPERKVRRLSGL